MRAEPAFGRRGAAGAATFLVVGLPLASGGRAPAQVGRCGAPARVVAVSRTHRSRIGAQPLRSGEAIALGAEIHVPVGGWLHLSRRGASARLGRGAVRLECAATRLVAGRIALVEVFDPQSFRTLIKNRTPVLAPAALGYRAWDAAGRDVTRLRFALRGSQHLPDVARWVVYAADAYEPGWTCFDRRLVCIPRWNYRLAGGLAPPLPPSARRLAIYAWDWAGNTSVRDVPLR